MKRKLCLISLMLLLVFMFTGCYSSDMNIKIGLTGKTTVTGSIVGTDESVASLFGNDSADADVTALIKEQIASLTDYHKQNPDDANKAVLSPLSTEDNGVKMNGVQYSLEYNDLEHMLSSTLFNSVNTMFPMASSDANGAIIVITSSDSMFGTTYKASGNLTVLGQLGQLTSGDMSKQFENAKASFTFQLPTPFVKSNATEKAAFGTKLIWNVTNGAPANISFSVFVPDIALLIAALIILLLIVIIFVLLGKIKKLNPSALNETEDGENEESLFEIPENELDSVGEETDEQDVYETETMDDEITEFSEETEAIEETEENSENTTNEQ